ncbi:hypothetical protein DICSQDRAFT_128849 [Dichomitus squalens LYAD-421 SS1]|uniref:F-box domain-containing protein n=1 Tax=Dichomitus squalens (strain LYAD-421) TaxID=732165 RepID=R7STU9_DICSQ|nr:uncharacterized protein DICSQDRAFT_128849 [Dichomitus squalens LYAD-421 SS1]EJF58412.1 hypothetical protein DICSQDRAFT_128849 [Dichomitus squalens LYAD-421 SS1]
MTTSDAASDVVNHNPTSMLQSLPPEVLERVLTFSNPRDVSRFAQTCRFARKLVYEPNDQFLWRELYLGRPFDDLRNAIPIPRRQSDTSEPEEEFPMPDIKGVSSPPWQQELQRRTQAELVAASGTRNARLLQKAYEGFLGAIETATPAIPTGDQVEEKQPESKPADKDNATVGVRSENLHWVDRILRKTRVLDLVPAYTGAIVDIPSLEELESASTPSESSDQKESTDKRPNSTADKSTQTVGLGSAKVNDAYDASDVCWIPAHFREVHQMRSRLRAYVALSHENSFDVESRARMGRLRSASRAFVYDMRKYQQQTLWGPFRLGEDERTLLVDWEHIEHIMNVVSLKLREVPLASLGYYKKAPFHLDALRANTMIDAHKLPKDDWAGVTGRWRRFVCFMDYRDLYMYNYSLLPPGPHDPSFFDDPFDEALRPVELHLSLISREDYFREPSRIPIDPSVLASSPEAKLPGKRSIGDCEDPVFPTLYFKGVSHGAAATVRGKVSVLSDGAVRWQFVTTYDGRMQWSAEGVQLGHVRSAAGIAGIWTGAHHDRDDPAGPFWMVKVNDNLPPGVLNALY